MIKQRKALSLVLAATLVFGLLANTTFAADGRDTGDRLSYDGVKYKLAQTANENGVFRDSRKGLLLYSYGSGATATFNETFFGEFEMEMKAVGRGAVPSLSQYALNFTSVSTGESFSVCINDTGSGTNAYVSVEDDQAGIYYETTYDDLAHGYTTVQNNSGNYTKVAGAHTTTIVFDPDTMEVKIKNVGGKEEYKTIWCLTKEIMDGKRFDHVFHPFDYYSVSIEFTSVGKKGELLIYNVNGADYGEVNLPYVEPTVNSNIELNAIVGQEYKLPEASLYGTAVEGKDKDISCKVYDENGKELADGKVTDGVSFVPGEVGTYYLYYSVSNQEGAGTYAKLKAYDQNSVKCTIAEGITYPESVGVNTTVNVLAREAKSDLFAEQHKVYTDIAIKNGEKTIWEEKGVSKATEYTFEKAGIYTIIWSVTIYGTTYEEMTEIKVDENVPGIVGAEFEVAYEKDSKLEIPEATVYVGGKEYSTKAQVIKPSGAVSDEKKVTLDEIGNYRVVYTYTAEKEQQFERSFVVDYSSKSLFIGGEKTEIYYDDTTGNADMPGVQVEMSSKNSSITYAKTLDLSDNTKLDTLLELYVIPETIGSADLSGFYVTLTDKLNPDNSISIRIVGGDGNMSSGSFIRAKASGQPGYVGLYKNHFWDQEPYTWFDELESTMQHNKGGYTCDLDLGFSQTVWNLQDKTLILRYDAKERALYSRQRVKLVHDENYREDLVVDFDDPEMFQNLWQGFTDDSQVELSITPLSLSGTATLKIMNIDGRVLNQEILADTTAPEIMVDYLGMKEVPQGKVGLPYRIFDVAVTDDLCADDTLIVTKTVRRNGEEVKMKDNTFTPEETGTYQICYSSTDGFGNTAEKVVEIAIGAEVPKLNAIAQSDFPENMTYGLNFDAPSFSGEGGSGKLTLRTYYVHNEEMVDFDGSFVPEEEGEYKVVCEVSDYVGQTAELTKTYTVDFEPEILFEDKNIVLPPVLLNEKVYEFGEYVASYYEEVGGKVKKANCTIEVTDADGTRTLEEDRLYTPKTSDTVKEATVKFIFKATVNKKEITKEITRTIPIHTVRADGQFLADYFIGENGNINVYNRFMTIAADNLSKDVKLTFVRPICARKFSVVLKASQTESGIYRSAYDKIRITLTDKNDPNIKVQFDVIKDNSELKLSVNDKSGIRMPGSITAETQANVELSYDNETFKVTGVENASLGSVENTLAGAEFAGFTSNEAYIQLEILGVNGDSAVDLISINNQTFLSGIADYTAPELFVNGSYSGTYVKGSEVTLPTADSYDVLSYTYQPTLTVTAPDGSEVKAVDGTVLTNAPADKEYTIIVEQFGQYVVNYTAKDVAEQTVSSSKALGIYDDILPTLKLKGSYKKSVKAGKSVKVKKYSIEGNGDTDKVGVKVYYESPTGVLSRAKDKKIKTKEKGTYIVYYYLTDENGNTNVQTFSFEAK